MQLKSVGEGGTEALRRRFSLYVTCRPQACWASQQPSSAFIWSCLSWLGSWLGLGLSSLQTRCCVLMHP